MDLITHLLMGTSLAACAGLRAWMPLLAVGLLGRGGYLHLNSSFELLTHTGTLAALAVATVLEVLGDKVILVDHLLDTVGSVVRPAAGALLSASVLTGMDPQTSLLLGLITGGSAAMSVHASKSAVRVGATALAPLHGGTGNIGLSLLEDLLAFGGIWAAVLAPVVAFGIIVLLMWIAYRMILRTRATGARLWQGLWGRRG